MLLLLLRTMGQPNSASAASELEIAIIFRPLRALNHTTILLSRDDTVEQMRFASNILIEPFAVSCL